MIIKFTDQASSKVMEVDKTTDGVSFFVYEYGEEQIGSEIILPLSEINNLIKFLQSINQLQ